ncbi:GNAT family N-acetyltransferase [Peribacillus huizhouensis]|uniref:Ribosomal protein S18 acetylase RimI-like enzyme n=1 Tax=Peribacillus huizhouensis TaxID=1501239 RepID=A0ABR6CUS3_9BACI|nr:GNAT family N-acetyltransferase [Peribacillus huizhouensis]MBA9028778.1 ribosomal protein S18 acetylase RimI-like enzyme [Peribacillus huizhouensis]
MLENEDVSLRLYESKYKAELAQFHLTVEQKKFTALPIEALKICTEDPNRRPIMVFSGEVPVGFFVLHTGEGIQDFSENPRTILLRAFCINHCYQGKKYASRAMAVLPYFVRQQFSDKEEIVLAVNKDNEPAKALYVKSGFRDTGAEKNGRSGQMHIYSYKLS